MRKAFIFGAGGHASVIASMLQDYSITFVLREPSEGDGQSVISEHSFFENADDYKKHNVYIGIGNNNIRRAIFDRLCSNGISPSICVASNAFIAHNASLEPGCVVCPGSAVMANARLSANVIVNTLSSVDHDCVVGAHSQITAGVTLGGGVHMGSNCFLGVKAAIIPQVRLGNDVIVMAGSVVTADMPDNVMIGGSPARIIRQNP